MKTPPTAEELAAVLAALAQRPKPVDPYRRWRERRVAALRQTSSR
jgi:hypothetical protein